jgi:hypothetical protein
MTPADDPFGIDDLFDAIARLLEPGQREYFYQRMLHFRHLRADDELLRIVEAIGFLTLLIREAPHAVAIERQYLAELLATHVATIEATAQAAQAYHQYVDDRVTRLPADIAQRISPPAIAQAITESLRQEFVRSGLPATAEALTVVSKQLQQTTREFQRASDQLTEAHHGAAAQAAGAIERVYTSVWQAAEATQGTLQQFRQRFRLDYWWSVGTLVPAALLMGILLGFILHKWMVTPAHAALPAVAPATEPATSTSQPGSSSAPTPTRWSTRRRLSMVADGTALEQPWNSAGTDRRARRPKPEA